MDGDCIEDQQPDAGAVQRWWLLPDTILFGFRFSLAETYLENASAEFSKTSSNVEPNALNFISAMCSKKTNFCFFI